MTRRTETPQVEDVIVPRTDEPHLRLEYIALSVLAKWPTNPKNHDERSIEQSFERHGFVEPIVIDERTGLMVVGHGRVETLEAMKGFGEPPPSRIILRNGEWYVPVIKGVSFADEDEAFAYLLTSNQLVIKGGWDEEALNPQIVGLTERHGTQALKGTGWIPEDVEDIVDLVAASQSQIQGTNPRRADQNSQVLLKLVQAVDSHSFIELVIKRVQQEFDLDRGHAFAKIAELANSSMGEDDARISEER